MATYVNGVQPTAYSLHLFLAMVFGRGYSGKKCNKRPDTLLKMDSLFSCAVESPGSWVTVGEFKSAKTCVSYMPSWQAKTLGKLMQEKYF